MLDPHQEASSHGYGMSVEDQKALGDHNRLFWDALKKADKKFGEGKQSLWDAGYEAQELRDLVPHGQWEDYCRHALGHDPAWIWRLIQFSKSCSYLEAANVTNIKAYLAPGQDMDDPGIENIEVADAEVTEIEEPYKEPVQDPTRARTREVLVACQYCSGSGDDPHSQLSGSACPACDGAGKVRADVRTYVAGVEVNTTTEPSRAADEAPPPSDQGELSMSSTCEICEGRGVILDKTRWTEVQCRTCHGTGQVWMNQGDPAADESPPEEGEISVQDEDPPTEAAEESGVDQQEDRWDVINKLQGELDDLHTEYGAQRERVEKLEGVIREKNKEIEHLQDKIRNQRHTLAEKNREVESLLRTRKGDEIEHLENEKEQLQAELDATRDQYRDLMAIIVRNDLEHILPEGSAS